MRWRRHRGIRSAPRADDPGTAVVLADQRWVGPTTLRLAGWAYAPGGSPLDLRSVAAIDSHDAVLVEGVLTARVDPRADLRPGDKEASHADAAFVAEINLGGLTEPGTRVELRLLGADGSSRRWNDSVPRSSARRRTSSGASQGRVIGARWNADHGLRISVEAAPAVLTDASKDGERVRLRIEGRRIERVALVEGGGEPRPSLLMERQGSSLVAASLTATQLTVADAALVADLADGSTVPVVWGAALLGADRTAPPPELVVRGSGRVGVNGLPAFVVDDVEAVADGIALRGEVVGPAGEIECELQGGTRTVPLMTTSRGRRHEVILPFLADLWDGPAALPADKYVLAAGVGAGAPQPRAVRIASPAYGQLPVVGGSQDVEIEVSGGGGGRLLVDARPVVALEERSDHGQERLRRRYVSAPSAPARVAYFECYYGASATDSGRAIHEELVRRGTDLELVWGVADRSVPVPPGGRGVVRGSREWWEVLAHASFLTFNAGLPPALVRRSGQRVVQTWHGTPLKLLGGDRTAVRGGTPEWDAWTRRSVARWDALLAPNPYSAEIFPRAWAYEGEVLQLGYPRNDALVRPDPEASARVRRRLAIPSDHVVVLYAPTWRDGDRVMPALLDVDALVRAMGDRFTLLVRGHMNITGWESSVRGGAVRDVTSYPEINDLYLVADAVVTDYSSIMFDFSVTGKPMVFFVPDLDDYRDRRRGLYFDLEATAPGPVVRETTDVVEALRGLDTLGDAYARRYEAWVATYNPRDDGRAAARAVDALFGEG